MLFFLFINCLVLDVLETSSDPVANCFVINMHEFNADLPAIRVFVGLDEVFQLPDALFFADASSILRMNVEFSLKICLSKSIGSVVSDSF